MTTPECLGTAKEAADVLGVDIAEVWPSPEGGGHGDEAQDSAN